MSDCQSRIDQFDNTRSKRRDRIIGHGAQVLAMVRKHAPDEPKPTHSAAATRAAKYGGMQMTG